MVRFKTHPDPKDPEGFLVTYEIVGSLVQDTVPFTVAFKNRFELDSAFMAGGIYLRDATHPDPERSTLPNPERDYEVSIDTLRKIGFNIPK